MFNPNLSLASDPKKVQRKAPSDTEEFAREKQFRILRLEHDLNILTSIERLADDKFVAKVDRFEIDESAPGIEYTLESYYSLYLKAGLISPEKLGQKEYEQIIAQENAIEFRINGERDDDKRKEAIKELKQFKNKIVKEVVERVLPDEAKAAVRKHEESKQYVSEVAAQDQFNDALSSFHEQSYLEAEKIVAGSRNTFDIRSNIQRLKDRIADLDHVIKNSGVSEDVIEAIERDIERETRRLEAIATVSRVEKDLNLVNEVCGRSVGAISRIFAQANPEEIAPTVRLTLKRMIEARKANSEVAPFTEEELAEVKATLLRLIPRTKDMPKADDLLPVAFKDPSARENARDFERIRRNTRVTANIRRYRLDENITKAIEYLAKENPSKQKLKDLLDNIGELQFALHKIFGYQYRPLPPGANPKRRPYYKDSVWKAVNDRMSKAVDIIEQIKQEENKLAEILKANLQEQERLLETGAFFYKGKDGEVLAISLAKRAPFKNESTNRENLIRVVRITKFPKDAKFKSVTEYDGLEVGTEFNSENTPEFFIRRGADYQSLDAEIV